MKDGDQGSFVIVGEGDVTFYAETSAVELPESRPKVREKDVKGVRHKFGVEH